MAGQDSGSGLSSVADLVGRYFSVLSVFPSAVLVVWVDLLDTSGAWNHDPDWAQAGQQLSAFNFGDLGRLGVISVLLGLALHPLQFAYVQFFEGYWGRGQLARRMMTWRIRFHLATKNSFTDAAYRARVELKRRGCDPEDPGADAIDSSTVQWRVDYDEYRRALLSYPQSANDIRPTLLGNVLRRFEAGAGVPYGLGLVTVAPHLRQIAREQDVAYLDDQRTQMDLAVRLLLISTLATLASMLFLWRDGLWLLIAIGPNLLAYVFYRGAVVTAAEYGTALSTVLDINRFELYRALHIPLPTTSMDEVDLGANLTTALRIDAAPRVRRQIKLTFRHDSATQGDS